MIERARGAFPAVIGIGVPFLLVFYLALEAGGYDIVLRSEVGIIIWWTILLGAVAGLLPVARVTKAGWIALAVLGALVAWTAIGTLTWTESTERSMVELSRNATLFGAFLLLIMTQGKEGLRRSVAAVGAAVAIIAIIALTDRFSPDFLPFGSSELLPESYPRARLNYPLEYWNGLAALIAMGLAPLIWVSASGRTVVARSLAAGVLPLLVLAAYLTASRGGVLEASMALVTLFLLYPKRLSLLFSMLVPALGSMLLIVLINRRPELRDLVPGDAASAQGTQMLWICLVVFAVVAGFQAAFTLLVQRGKLVLPAVGYTGTRRTGIAAAAVTGALLLAGLASGFVGDRWSDFKQPVQGGSTVTRLGSLNSSERYFLWDSALEAASSEKLTGIGPGTFEYWWAREGKGGQFVRDAHSLYLESFAEMGPIGLLLSIAIVLGSIALAASLAWRQGSNERRGLLAVATAGMVAFAVAAGVDWAWEMTVLPVAFLALVAAALGPDAEIRPLQRESAFSVSPSGWRIRSLVAVGSLVAIAVIAVPLVGAERLRSSQSLVRSGDLDQALDEARSASDLQPYAASAKIQEAQILSLLGRDGEGAHLAREATVDEPGNWRNWYVLAQILAGSSPDQARQAADRARELNPKSAPLQAEAKALSE